RGRQQLLPDAPAVRVGVVVSHPRVDRVGRRPGRAPARAGAARTGGGRVMGVSRPEPIVVVIGRYPLVTTTFVDREILELRRQGLPIEIVSIRRPPDDMP